MEKPSTSPDTPAVRLVEKPQSAVSTVANGVFNGATIGGGIFILPQVAVKFFNPRAQFNHNYYRATVLSTVIGSAIGTYFSMKEAKQVNDYRAALVKDIETLHAQIDGIDPRLHPSR